MLHGPAVELGKDKSVAKKTRLGVVMFAIYMVVYIGFVLIGTLFPKILGAKFIGGQNLAFLYGMGLIVLAVIMGLIYNFLCTRLEDKLNKEEHS
jgi:putative solute:sodium symporter small subunit